jgi:hypothetical protein
MNKREIIVEFTGDEDLLFVDPERFDAAIIGVTERIGDLPTICYSKDKVLEILMEDGMSWEEAGEYYNFNIVGAYMGEYTPTFLEAV